MHSGPHLKQTCLFKCTQTHRHMHMYVHIHRKSPLIYPTGSSLESAAFSLLECLPLCCILLSLSLCLSFFLNVFLSHFLSLFWSFCLPLSSFQFNSVRLYWRDILIKRVLPKCMLDQKVRLVFLSLILSSEIQMCFIGITICTVFSKHVVQGL